MDDLFDEAPRAKLLRRIDALRPDSPRAWGKMNPAQMLAHVSETLEVASGEKPMKRMLIGRIIGPFARGGMLGPKPFSKNSPTHPRFVIQDARDFAHEKERLVGVIGRFAAAGKGNAAKQVHGFIGRLSGDEWGRLMAKHLDHHLTQFGV